MRKCAVYGTDCCAECQHVLQDFELWTAATLLCDIAYNAASTYSEHSSGLCYDPQSLLLFASVDRRNRKSIHLASVYPVAPAYQRTDVSDVWRRQNGGAKGHAQSAGSHTAGIWPYRRMARGDYRSATVSP